MVGWKLVNFVSGLKVAAFKGNPCTEISIYDGVRIGERLTTEFKTKCSVDCGRAALAAQKDKTEWQQEIKVTRDCLSSYEPQQPRRDPYGYNHMRNAHSGANSASGEN